jgi:putative FmdB family regulatory protein
MPTYTYRCDTGGHQFETFQRFADDPLRECPTCGAAVRRVIQPVGVVFKGSGWYINDSRPKPSDESKPAGANADKGDKAEKDVKVDKPATDAKPAAADAARTTEKAAASAAVKPAAD